MTVVPHPPISLFSQLTIKLIGHHFDTIELIESESQAELNALTEHGFQETAKAVETVRTRGMGLLQG
jgi:hypothetical protein